MAPSLGLRYGISGERRTCAGDTPVARSEVGDRPPFARMLAQSEHGNAAVCRCGHVCTRLHRGRRSAAGRRSDHVRDTAHRSGARADLARCSIDPQRTALRRSAANDQAATLNSGLRRPRGSRCWLGQSFRRGWLRRAVGNATGIASVTILSEDVASRGIADSARVAWMT